jgi:hypothetical protein
MPTSFRHCFPEPEIGTEFLSAFGSGKQGLNSEFLKPLFARE